MDDALKAMGQKIYTARKAAHMMADSGKRQGAIAPTMNQGSAVSAQGNTGI